MVADALCKFGHSLEEFSKFDYLNLPSSINDLIVKD